MNIENKLFRMYKKLRKMRKIASANEGKHYDVAVEEIITLINLNKNPDYKPISELDRGMPVNWAKNVSYSHN